MAPAHPSPAQHRAGMFTPPSVMAMLCFTSKPKQGGVSARQRRHPSFVSKAKQSKAKQSKAKHRSKAKKYGMEHDQKSCYR
ncbi:hypothetical protein HYFRA_00013597 [Hymenoscyphus fraxineus]|uniref:Uncharacterized protein n=1 Tax=Hymenoscyphus fraxineus TaxID=746836 RepID=A0A9N9LAD6_9HELO|nr:hypothetical protein HYFRA_00013597 [Hymenoscyphus fraxineus]